MRQLILDTETTGLEPKEGHRVIEIGCVELIDRMFTGKTFHCYLNPEREIDAGALKVHGINQAFLANKPRFTDIVEELLDYVQDAELIIHNAPFDVGFLNHELTLTKRNLGLITQYCKIFDTLVLARQLHPGQRNNLDALCKRYDIDNTDRDLHGALIDAKLLGKVYIAMTGGQDSLFGESHLSERQVNQTFKNLQHKTNSEQKTKIIYANQNEQQTHQHMMELLKKKSKREIVWE